MKSKFTVLVAFLMTSLFIACGDQGGNKPANAPAIKPTMTHVIIWSGTKLSVTDWFIPISFQETSQCVQNGPLSRSGSAAEVNLADYPRRDIKD